MSHKIHIGEDGYPGSDRWCVHCSCGWSGTFVDRPVYNRDRKNFPGLNHRMDMDWGRRIGPWAPLTYETREHAEAMHEDHLMEVMLAGESV